MAGAGEGPLPRIQAVALGSSRRRGWCRGAHRRGEGGRPPAEGGERELGVVERDRMAMGGRPKGRGGWELKK
jgi:hypothetical protein